MKVKYCFLLFPMVIQACCAGAQSRDVIDLNTLLTEMVQSSDLARFPAPFYQQLEASSYNRASVSPFEKGWFADSDNGEYLYKDTMEGRNEYVIMEHNGPGCITRMWTPYFYYSLGDHIGPNIRIYIDGEKKPVIKANFIQLLTGASFIKPPFAGLTTRAGVLYFPIPFKKRCIVTLDKRPFYYSISYRAYPRGTRVESYSSEGFAHEEEHIKAVASALTAREKVPGEKMTDFSGRIDAGDSISVVLPAGPHAIRRLRFELGDAVNVGALRNVLLKITFDGCPAVWCPLGDFFCSADKINPFSTRFMGVSGNVMQCRWVMPYKKDAKIALVNLCGRNIRLSLKANTGSWHWDKRSMYFHASWCNFGYLPGNKFFDLNFVSLTGRGVLVGDALTVLSPSKGWWGEGDEKIYIDKKDIERHFPSEFGTGTEDYYGWAGGVVPTGRDTFSIPFGSNVRVGNKDNPSGYNICTRNRILDAVPFDDQLKFDMEASAGVDIRNAYDLLTYSAVAYWYGVPGAACNRDPDTESVKGKLMTLPEIKTLEEEIKAGRRTLDTDALYKRTQLFRTPETVSGR